MKNNIIKKILYPFYKAYKQVYYAYYKNHQKLLADKIYLKNFGKHVDWNNPKGMNEKIIWMEFNTNTSLWSQLADKYLARKYLEDNGYKNLLVPLLGVWSNAKDIDFNTLPESFVLKTNHGCGDVIIIKDKSKTNLRRIRKRICKALKQSYGITTAEPHYSKIKPCIIAEKLLTQDTSYSSSLIDYKFYCVNGEVLCCGVFYDRVPGTHITNSTFYDSNWNRHDEWRSKNIRLESKNIPKPMSLDHMLEICKDLSKNIPFVRLDFYEVNNKPFFGEFTFTPAAYTGGSLSKEMCKFIGEKIILPKEDNV